MEFKPVAFEPYAGKHSLWRVPRSLLMLVLGAAAGGGGVMVAQERLLPPRLSSSESAALRSLVVQTEQERERAKDARADQDFLIASLPPDPRAGAVQVRAARLTKQRGALGYEVLLMRSQGDDTPLAGVMQFVVTGLTKGGIERHITLEPINVSVGLRQSLRGSLPLPETFNPKQTTINVLDRVGGKPLGMRVVYVY
jgi:hypothetical protein